MFHRFASVFTARHAAGRLLGSRAAVPGDERSKPEAGWRRGETEDLTVHEEYPGPSGIQSIRN